jgi:DNA invertase Pin-like site-specific DNA recombinase
MLALGEPSFSSGDDPWTSKVRLSLVWMQPRPDTRNRGSKLMLTIPGGVATREREIMLERQREAIAKARG